MHCTLLSVRTTLSPELQNHTIKNWVMVDLGVTSDQKFVPDTALKITTSLYLHVI